MLDPAEENSNQARPTLMRLIGGQHADLLKKENRVPSAIIPLTPMSGMFATSRAAILLEKIGFTSALSASRKPA